MAGPFWGSIASGFFEGQDKALSREEEQLRIKELKRQAEQNEKIRSNMGAGMAAMAALAPPPQQGPQAPPPGMSSQPMQPPRPMPGQGPQMPPGMMPPPPGGQGAGGSGIPAMGGGQFAGPPPKMGAPGGAPPLPPYQSPQPPAQMGPQGANGIAPPPQQQQGPQGAPSLRELILAIKQRNPGLDDETVFGIATRFEPMLNQEGKMQLAMAQQEIARLRAEAQGRQAGAAEKRADTGAAGEKRREATAEGANPLGKAKIDQAEASADASRARAGHVRQMTSGDRATMKAGKPVVFTGDDGRQYSRQLTSDGKIVVKDANGLIVPEGTEGSHSAGSAGQQTMRNTVKLDISELDLALGKLKQDETSSPFFMDRKDKGAATRWATNKLTPTEMQTYDVYANRIATAIAGIQSMGRGLISDSKVNEARKLVPAPGDAPETIKAKLGQIKAIRDNANEILKGKSPDELLKPKPSDADRAYVKAHPETAADFKAHFGVAP